MSRVVYPKILAIEAQKPDGSRWRHAFKKRAAIIGNSDGSLSIRAKGARLHKLFPWKGRQEPFLVNPPRGYVEARRAVVVERMRAPRHRAAALKGWLFRNPWKEEREPVKVDLFKAPKHRAAAVAAYEHGEMAKYYHKLGYGRRTRKFVGRRGMPAALAQWHHERAQGDERVDYGRGPLGFARGGRRESVSYNPPSADRAGAIAGIREWVSTMRKMEAAGNVAGARQVKRNIERAIREENLQPMWGEFFGKKKAGGTRRAMQGGLFTAGAVDQGLLFANPPRRTRATRKNPYLQILNPPRSASMSKRRMPPALARYWAKKRAKKSSSTRKRRTAAKETIMARKRHYRRRKVHANPPRRRHTSRRRHHYRRNPPAFLPRMGEVTSVLKDGAAVTAGLIIPTLALRVPALAKFADTKPKRIAAKAILGFAASRLAKRFIGPRYSALVLVGTAAGLVLDVLPVAAPQLGLGLSDVGDQTALGEMMEQGYAEMPGISEMPGLSGAYDRPGMDQFAETDAIV